MSGASSGLTLLSNARYVSNFIKDSFSSSVAMPKSRARWSSRILVSTYLSGLSPKLCPFDVDSPKHLKSSASGDRRFSLSRVYMKDRYIWPLCQTEPCHWRKHQRFNMAGALSGYPRRYTVLQKNFLRGEKLRGPKPPLTFSAMPKTTCA